MNGGLSAPFIKRPIATSLLMVGLLFVGIVAYPLLPVAPLPQIDFPTIQVSGNLPGASPDTMASSVAQPLETQFAQIPGIAQMTSQSSLGSTQITLQFDLDRNIDGAANDVQAAINAAGGQLPKDLPNPPTYRKVNPADSPILILSATSDTLPIIEVDDQIETKMSQQLSQIQGVGQVYVGGQQKPSVRVQVDPGKLVSKSLTLEDIRAQMVLASVNASKGSLNGTVRNYTIFANDQLLHAKGWNDVIVAYRNGAPLRIRDVGKAVDAPQDFTQAAWSTTKRGIFLVVFKQAGANVVDTVDRIKKALPRLTKSLPPAISINTISDRTTTIRASLDDVQFTLMLTIALVVMVIFVFLRSVWATVIPSIAVPLALLGACALMWVLGYSLDNLSLMALTISVGFVVDDAIVVLENISRYIEQGMRPYEAAMKGAGEIGFTVFSISLSLVAVLIPLLLMGGIIGRLFREFAIVLSMTILVSAVVSLTLTPMMASRFLKSEHEVRHGRLYRWSEACFDALLRAYERGLDVVLRHRFITLMAFFATLAGSVYLFMVIPKGFFPQQDTGLIVGISEGSQDISSDGMIALQEKLGAIVAADPAVYAFASAVGGQGFPINNGRMYIQLKPRDERDVTADQVIARLRPKAAHVEGGALFLQASQDVRVGGRASRTQFQYTLQDADLAEVTDAATKMLARMKKMPQLRDVATDQQSNGTTLTLEVNRDQASRYGITPSLIDATLADAFGQRQVTQFFTQLSSYYAILEVSPKLRGDLTVLDRIYIRSPANNALVPMSTFAKWTTVPIQPLSVSHQSQFPAITLSFNLAPNVALGDATNAIQQAAVDLKLPPTVVTGFQGNAQAFQASLSTVPLLIVAALIVVYLILGMLYESYIHPITILSTLPSAGVGALAMLMAFGYDFNLIGLIGIILLIGIVKKNGIMLVDFAIVAEREDHLSPLESIRRACLLRFRPILMTTMAALLGGVPLMLGTGTGSELRQPLGYSMVGGLLVSQVLTLFTTPVVYLYLDRVSNWLAGRGTAVDAPAEVAAPQEPQRAAAE